jgi:hypothetical protein
MLVIPEIRAQEVIVRAELDTSSALIGDQINLRLIVSKPASAQVNFPFLRDTLSPKVEIISISAIDTASHISDTFILHQNLLISVFDTGFFEIPPLDFPLNFHGVQDTLRTLPIFFRVYAVKTDSTLRDIKAIYKVPLSFREITPYLLLLIAIGILTWFLIYYLKKRKKGERLMSVRNPLEPPDVIALRALQKLKEEKPWMYNKVKYFHIRISEILRVYIEQRFHIPALEQTTDEILSSLKPTMCKDSEISRLSSVLKLADLVKFAKVIPDIEEDAKQLSAASEFVVETSKTEDKAPTSPEKDNTFVHAK